MADAPRFGRLRRWFSPDHARRTVTYLLLVVGFLVGLGYGSWTRVCAGRACPSIAILDDYRPQMASKVYAMDGRLVTELGYQRRTVMPLAEMPPYLRQAFIAVEDKHFYRHHGIDYSRILGALKADILTRSFSQGFSTITMQLARNVFQDRISREKTLVRKFREMRVALELERTYSKDRILELYLNQISFGNGYGVETAAQRFFGKSARDVTIPEAALLAAIPKAPNTYNPRRSPARAVQRRNLVLELMRQQGYLTTQQAEEAEAYPLTLSARQDYGDVAPYFVEWVREELDRQFGRDLYEKGYRVYTTLDLDMQQAAERTLEAQLEAVESGAYGKFPHRTYAQYLAASNGTENEEQVATPYLQGAMVAMDTSGAVRALVGGRDFDDSKFNRAVQAQRQPGSTFKLFVYSAALRAGHSPEEQLPDSAISLPMSDGTIWEPHNFEQEDSQGLITLRRALALSINLVAIRLGMELGVDAVVDEARRYGLSTPVPAVPSMFIGSASVIPIEMVSAYTVPATLGVRAQPFAVTRVEDAAGKVLWQQEPHRERVMSTDQSFVLNDMLRDVIRYGTGAGAVRRSGFDLPAGGKSGTTNDYTDVWFIGYTHELVAGFWMGFDTPQTIKSNAQGGLLTAPAWANFMKEVYERRPPSGDWFRPTGMVQREVDVSTGKLATPYCPANLRRWEVFAPDAVPTEFCPVHTGPGTGASAPPSAAPAPTDGGNKPPKRPPGVGG